MVSARCGASSNTVSDFFRSMTTAEENLNTNSRSSYSNAFNRAGGYSFFIAAFLFFLNLYIKSFEISAVGFDLDEAWHSFFSQKSFSEIIRIAGEDPNGPLYNLLLHFWMQIVGVSEVSIRWLSVLLSAVTAPLIYIFGKKYFNTLAGIFAALLFSFSNIHFFFSHNARVYALICMLAVLSFYLFIKLIRTKRTSVLAWFIIVNTLIIYTHLTTVFIFAVQFIAALFFLRESKRGALKTVAGLAISAALFIPWVLTSAYYTKHAPVSWMEPPHWWDLRDTVMYLCGSPTLLIIFLTLAVLPVLLFIFKKNLRTDWHIYIVALLWFGLPLVLNYITSLYLVSILVPKYVLYSSLGLFLLAGYSLSVLPVHKFFRVIFLAILLYVSYGEIGFRKYAVEQWREVTQHIKKQKTDRTMIIVSPDYQFVSFSFYYNNDFFRNTDSTKQLLERDRIFLGNTPDIILEHPTDYDTIIFLTSHEKIQNPDSMLRFLRHNFTQYCDSAFYGIRMYCFRKKPGLARFYCDMESPAQSFQPHRTEVKSFARSGKKVCVLDMEQAYSSTFEDRVGAFSLPSAKFKACGWVYTETADTNCVLVVSIENKMETYFYKTVRTAELAIAGKWFQVCREFEIPMNASPNDKVKVYFWNKGKSTIYIDDMEITELKSH